LATLPENILGLGGEAEGRKKRKADRDLPERGQHRERGFEGSRQTAKEDRREEEGSGGIVGHAVKSRRKKKSEATEAKSPLPSQYNRGRNERTWGLKSTLTVKTKREPREKGDPTREGGICDKIRAYPLAGRL